MRKSMAATLGVAGCAFAACTQFVGQGPEPGLDAAPPGSTFVDAPPTGSSSSGGSSTSSSASSSGDSAPTGLAASTCTTHPFCCTFDQGTALDQCPWTYVTPSGLGATYRGTIDTATALSGSNSLLVEPVSGGGLGSGWFVTRAVDPGKGALLAELALRLESAAASGTVATLAFTDTAADGGTSNQWALDVKAETTSNGSVVIALVSRTQATASDGGAAGRTERVAVGAPIQQNEWVRVRLEARAVGPVPEHRAAITLLTETGADTQELAIAAVLRDLSQARLSLGVTAGLGGPDVAYRYDDVSLDSLPAE